MKVALAQFHRSKNETHSPVYWKLDLNYEKWTKTSAQLRPVWFIDNSDLFRLHLCDDFDTSWVRSGL